MSSDSAFIEYVNDQLSDIPEISTRKMFGEYALYLGDKVVALICSNQVFVKPTDEGKTFIGNTVEAPPYAGAKNYYLIDEGLENREWLGELVRKTAEALPEPKKRKKRPTGR